jgi:uncharacterized protein YecE (DUF72 family)
MALFAGTSGWAYATWKPGFYPAKWPQKRFLEHYATRLNSVEVNYTFRALPTETQLAGWMEAAGPDFRFSFKAPEIITHRKRLKECGDSVDRFLTALTPVRNAGRMGALLFQLPPNFKADVARLEDFLSLPQMAHAGRVCFEFRNVSWFDEATWSVLRRFNAAVCIAESEDLKTPEIQTAKDFACYRLRLAGGYDDVTIADQAATFHALAAERDVFVYYKHEDDPAGPLAAEAMRLQAAEL